MNCVFNENRVCPTPDTYGACYYCQVNIENAVREVAVLETEPIHSEVKNE